MNFFKMTNREITSMIICQEELQKAFSDYESFNKFCDLNVLKLDHEFKKFEREENEKIDKFAIDQLIKEQTNNTLSDRIYNELLKGEDMNHNISISNDFITEYHLQKINEAIIDLQKTDNVDKYKDDIRKLIERLEKMI